MATAQQLSVPKYQGPLGGPVNAPLPQLTLPTPPAITPNGTVVEDVIVRVNDQVIDRSELERAMKSLDEEARQTQMSPADLAERRKDVLRDMMDQQLLLSRGKELELNADTQVIKELDEIRKQNKFDSMEELEKAIRQSGTSYEDFKAHLRDQIITQQVVRDEVGRNLRLTARQEQAYYEQHKQEYMQPEQVKLSEILIPTPADANDATVAQAQAKANDVAAKLKAGAKFEDLAKQYSGGPTADKGGELGDFKRGVLAKVLEDQTFPLKAGEVTAPIRTRQGFVLLKVVEHIPAGVPPMKDIDQQLQEAIYREQIQPALRTYLTKLREEAYIDIAPGFVDSGASPNETKPVFSAYAPPVPKKKSEAAKQRLETGRGPAGTPVAGSAAAGTASGAASGKPPAIGATSGSSSAAVAGSSAGSGTIRGTARGKSSAGSLIATSTPALDKHGKPKKVRREKVRFGQSPRESLPTGTADASLTPGMAGPDLGRGGQSVESAMAPGTAIAPVETTIASNENPLNPKVVDQGKTRYSARWKEEEAARVAAKAAKVKEKASAVPIPMTAEDKIEAKAQDAPLGLNGDTATKKKKPKREKGAEKERLQGKAPAPPAPKPQMTPIPPKSVRDNGEPAVTPAPAPPADTAPAPAK
jgi:peptidyl-prolyl cis-trans isomerase SurA